MSATLQQADRIIDDESLAEEKLLEELENEEVPAELREARLSQLKQMTQDFHQMKERQHGKYTEILEEKDFLEMTTTVARCVVHFFHSDFRRCAIMDSHLSSLAARHFGTKFARINVDVAKFFVTKLKVQILPAVFCFVKGIVIDRVIGFEELSEDGTDDFPTESLERRLIRSGVIIAGGNTGKSSSTATRSSSGRGGASGDVDEDSDNDDW